jgi:hypothetical protein
MKVQKWLFGLIAFAILQLGIVLPLIAADYVVSDIALTPGANASQLNFAWITDDFGTGECAVKIIQANDKSQDALIFTGPKAKASDGKAQYSYCEVTVSDLKSQQQYSYLLGDNQGQWSDTYRYSTRNEKQYGVVYLADAQIGASMGRRPSKEQMAEAAANDEKSWQKNVSLIINKFPETAFILSAGDQIETPGNEDQWSGFFSPQELTSIPLAPTPAAHDELGDLGHSGYVSSYAFDYHFNLPNEGERAIIHGATTECPPPHAPDFDPACTENLEYVDLEAAAGDYYFTYGDALYIVLNMDSEDYEKHDAFIKSAIAANPQVTWKIAMWHYTIYTAATRHPFVDRDIMANMMEQNNIDLALQGHDHTYCRTFPMLKDVPQKEEINDKGESVNPAGVVYLTANSASGSKYYTLNPEADTLYYAAVFNQENKPTFSYIGVDANRLKITTYKTETMEVIDSYTMVKK